ncbi:AsmA-like C-terminal region-containing protein [Flavobacterium sp. '19STA2R22 D10 B1']|uniref:AsmA family protein n=1 Tax=Flavobacterium aerium TaxID=3037261 RepID=UPI00278C2113|nr:AsmA-like C-terminal region-containing protein [Flavobacterium sp. '19STA2R22 D10 B1']
MIKKINGFRDWWKQVHLPKWVKITLRALGVVFVIILIAYVSTAWYVNANKEKVLALITTELNKNINGTLTIKSMEPSFLKGFPRVSLELKDIILRDSLWQEHQHTVLEAKDFEVAVNTLALLRGTIEIKKVTINDATIYLYTDEKGYSNTAVFGKKKKETKDKEDSGSYPEIRKFQLQNVNFIADNKQNNKRFEFEVKELYGVMDYSFGNWDADIQLTTMAKSLAFSTVHGSFIKDKMVEGRLSAHFNKSKEIITVDPNDLNIGGDIFNIGAKFNVGPKNADFTINIIASNILWKRASNLLSNNISSKLNKFDLNQPIYVTCDLVGDMNAEGDPYIHVKAEVKNNRLSIPGGVIESCNFSGEYTNDFVKGEGYTDANSAVKLFHLKGEYEQIPFTIDTFFINNFDKPIATGLFKSTFDLPKLNNMIGHDLLKFSKGTADVKLAYKSDVVDFKLTKPLVSGSIEIKDADLDYIPRQLNFKNTAISLSFKDDNLSIKNIRLQSGKSIVFLEGNVENFLNLYYTAPEKIVLNWQVYSPQLHLAEFLGFLGSRRIQANKKKSKQSNFTEELNAVFEKSNVAMHLKVDKIFYNKFLATNATADVLLSESGMSVDNVSVNHADGTLKMKGSLAQTGASNRFAIQANVNHVDIRKFFGAFNNFGLESLTAKNLRGYLSSTTTMSGNISNKGIMIPRSMNGEVQFNVNQGALVGFESIKNVGKFAFPFRDLDNITFSKLNGKFDVKGEKVTISPMQINSSVLNMDIAGVYSFGLGTNIALDVPLRNPKNDKEIKDKQEVKERRNRGIVLHLLVTDGDDGKVKIRLNKNRDKKDTSKQ